MRELIVENLTYEEHTDCDQTSNIIENVNLKYIKHGESKMNSLSLLEKILKLIDSNDKFCSMELSPPKIADYDNLHLSIIALQEECNPLFCAITWHLEPQNIEECKSSALKLASTLVNFNVFNRDILLHLAATHLTENKVMTILSEAKNLGLQNLFVIRGDRTGKLSEASERFHHAVDLVRFIREKFGNYFVICVAGYPNGHPEAVSYKQDLQYLKDKVDAGADFIISQIIFEVQDFINFVHCCRYEGITVPILPGIMPIQSFKSLAKMAHICCLKIPHHILNILQPIMNNNEAVMNYGIYHAVNLVKQLFSLNSAPGAHFFTLNRDAAIIKICKQLELSLPCIERPIPQKYTQRSKSPYYYISTTTTKNEVNY